MRENPSTRLTCRRVPEKGAKIKIILVIFHPCAQKSPVDGYAPNLAQPQGSPTNFDNFFGDRLRGVDSVGVENFPFPLTKPVAVNTGLALYRTLDWSSSYFVRSPSGLRTRRSYVV